MSTVAAVIGMVCVGVGVGLTLAAIAWLLAAWLDKDRLEAIDLGGVSVLAVSGAGFLWLASMLGVGS